MTATPAIKVAIGLLHLPSSVRLLRTEPLPSDIESLLRIAAGDAGAETDIAALTDRPPEVIREAAAFFIEQVLFSPDADNYRVLGAAPAASANDLRRNMALLLSWLHPDKNPSGERAVFAARVTGAWDTLRHPERRAAYDAAIQRNALSRRPRAGGHDGRTLSRLPNRLHQRTPDRRNTGPQFNSLTKRILAHCWQILRQRSAR